MKLHLSVRQVCEKLPVSKSLVYRLVNDGTIPSTRFGAKNGRGGKILIPEDALEAILACNAGEPAEPPCPSPKSPPLDSGFSSYFQKIMAEAEKKAERRRQRRAKKTG